MKKILAFCLLLLVVTSTSLLASATDWSLVTSTEDGAEGGAECRGWG